MENEIVETHHIDENEDQTLCKGILLPTYDDMTDQKVLKNVRDIFKGFSFDSTDNYGVKFKDTEQLAEYVQASMEDITTCRSKAEASELIQRSASMARFWYMGAVLDKALTEGAYGTAASNKLAVALKKSVPYIYQIRAVATKLTVTDCYLLGMRGCDSTILRKLAQIKDDEIRKGIIKAFIEMYINTADRNQLLAARKALVNAINADQKTDFIEVSTSDPVAGGSNILVSPEYQAVVSELNSWTKMLKKASQEATITKFCNATASFYLTKEAPDAEKHMEEVKTFAETVRQLIATVKANLADAESELQSLQATEVLDNAPADSSSNS